MPHYRKRKRTSSKTYKKRERLTAPAPEMKHFDTALAATTINTSGLVTSASINLIPRGTSADERIGRQVTVRKIMVRGSIELRAQEDPAQTANKFRVVLYLDKQANGTAATWLDVMQSADIDSFRELENNKRFRILHDKFHTLNVGGGGQNSAGTKTWAEVYRHVEMYVDCNIKLEFGDTATPTIADMRSGNIGIMVIAREPQTTNTPRIEYITRLRYTDG